MVLKEQAIRPTDYGSSMIKVGAHHQRLIGKSKDLSTRKILDILDGQSKFQVEVFYISHPYCFSKSVKIMLCPVLFIEI